MVSGSWLRTGRCWGSSQMGGMTQGRPSREHDDPHAGVHFGVMPGAQQQQIGQVGGAAELPGDPVVRVAPAREGAAAGDEAAAVAGGQGAALCGGGEAAGPAVVEDLPERADGGAFEDRVAGQHPERERGQGAGLLAAAEPGRAAGPPQRRAGAALAVVWPGRVVVLAAAVARRRGSSVVPASARRRRAASPSVGRVAGSVAASPRSAACRRRRRRVGPRRCAGGVGELVGVGVDDDAWWFAAAFTGVGQGGLGHQHQRVGQPLRGAARVLDAAGSVGRVRRPHRRRGPAAA